MKPIYIILLTVLFGCSQTKVEYKNYSEITYNNKSESNIFITTYYENEIITSFFINNNNSIIFFEENTKIPITPVMFLGGRIDSLIILFQDNKKLVYTNLISPTEKNILQDMDYESSQDDQFHFNYSYDITQEHYDKAE